MSIIPEQRAGDQPATVATPCPAWCRAGHTEYEPVGRPERNGGER